MGSVDKQGDSGQYWSSTANSDKAYLLYFDSNFQFVYGSSRIYGYSVRAVLAE